MPAPERLISTCRSQSDMGWISACKPHRIIITSSPRIVNSEKWFLNMLVSYFNKLLHKTILRVIFLPAGRRRKGRVFRGRRAGKNRSTESGILNTSAGFRRQRQTQKTKVLKKARSRQGTLLPRRSYRPLNTLASLEELFLSQKMIFIGYY